MEILSTYSFILATNKGQKIAGIQQKTKQLKMMKPMT